MYQDRNHIVRPVLGAYHGNTVSFHPYNFCGNISLHRAINSIQLQSDFLTNKIRTSPRMPTHHHDKGKTEWGYCNTTSLWASLPNHYKFSADFKDNSPCFVRRFGRSAMKSPHIAKFMGLTWGPPGSCRPQMGPMLAPWTLLSGTFSQKYAHLQPLWLLFINNSRSYKVQK